MGSDRSAADQTCCVLRLLPRALPKRNGEHPHSTEGAVLSFQLDHPMCGHRAPSVPLLLFAHQQWRTHLACCHRPPLPHCLHAHRFRHHAGDVRSRSAHRQVLHFHHGADRVHSGRRLRHAQLLREGGEDATMAPSDTLRLPVAFGVRQHRCSEQASERDRSANQGSDARRQRPTIPRCHGRRRRRAHARSRLQGEFREKGRPFVG